MVAHNIKKIPFTLQRPSWVKSDTKDDNVVFYNNIELVLKEWNHPYTITSIPGRYPCGIEVSSHHGILLSYHTIKTKPNLWNLKKGYIPHYMNFDRCGFSGWSEMAVSKNLFTTSQQENVERSTKFVDTFISEYAAKNISKYPQETESFEIDKPFLFMACQRPLDIVSRLARIDTYTLAEQVVDRLSGNINIVIKLHPKEINNTIIDHLKKLPNVFFSNASIHQLIPKSEGVITVNSGVGFEALFYGKHVFTSGSVDYQWVTHHLTNISDIDDVLNIINAPPDLSTINKFLFYMMKTHFVQGNNKHSIQQHLQRALREYKRNT